MTALIFLAFVFVIQFTRLLTELRVLNTTLKEMHEHRKQTNNYSFKVRE